MNLKPIKTNAPTRKELINRSYVLFDDWHLRIEWVKQSLYLYETGKHLALTGKYPKQ
jgi:hypothetical protein